MFLNLKVRTHIQYVKWMMDEGYLNDNFQTHKQYKLVKDNKIDFTFLIIHAKN